MASYWLEDPHEPVPRTALAGAPEVEIVGGGVTGCSCALALASAGVRVRLHEAREIAGGASGRNGGFALRGGVMAYDRALRQLGPERARAYWQLTERTIERMAGLAGDALRRVGSLRLAVDTEELAELRAEHDALTADGFEAVWHDRDTLAPHLRELFAGALEHPPDASIHPARWVRALARHAAAAGAEVRAHSRVDSLDSLEADRVVVATDGYTHGLVPALDERIRATRGQVVATEPLPELRYPRPHYARHGYDYWQQTPDGRLVLGGSRDVGLDAEWTRDEATTEVVQRGIESLVERLVGHRPAITHRWSGIWGTTADGLPLVGPVESGGRVWIAAGYSGHGNVLGFASGELVARALLGDRDPILAALDPLRAS